MIHRDVLEMKNENKHLIVEYYVWEDKSTFKKMAFVSDEEIIKINDYTY